MIYRWIIIFVSVAFIYAGSGWAGERRVVVGIDGISCSLCTIAIKRSLGKIEGITKIEVSGKKKEASFTAEEEVSDEVLVEAIQRAGAFEVRGIYRGPDQPLTIEGSDPKIERE